MHEPIFYLVLRHRCEAHFTGLHELDDHDLAIQTQKVTIVLAISVHTSSDKGLSDSYNPDTFFNWTSRIITKFP